ncbi:MAG: EamA family transporter [Actinomycetota bacterium]
MPLYLVLALASALLFGIWQFALGQFRGRVPREIVLLGCCAASAVVYLGLGLATGNFVVNSTDAFQGIAGGLLNVGGTLLVLKAYEMGRIGVITGVAASYALVPLAYSFILGESLSPMAFAGLVVIIFGLIIFYVPAATSRTQGESNSLRGILIALLAAGLWGLAIIVLDLGTRVSLTGTMFMSQLPQLLVTLLIAFAINRVSVRPSGQAVGIMVGAGVAVALAQGAFFTAANEGDIGVVSVLGSLSPLVTALLALWLLGERMARLETAALVAVVIGTGLLAL